MTCQLPVTARGAGDYRGQLAQLLPPGEAWSAAEEEGSNLRGLLAGLAVELARIEARILELLCESDPRDASELLPDWERLVGGDPCRALAFETLAERRAWVVQKLTARGGQSRAFYIAVAAALGYQITITEFTPFRTGTGTAGQGLDGADWWFVWRVNASGFTVRAFRTGQNAAGDPLRIWGNALLECVLRRIAPAHTLLLFGYSSGGALQFDDVTNSGLLPLAF